MDEDEFPSNRVIHQPPSCIEFCPADPSILIVGTYKLEETQVNSSSEGAEAQSRSGRVEVYQITRKHGSSSFGISQCIDKYDFPDCAVLDLHFRPQEPTFFAVCTSTSQIVFFGLQDLERCQGGGSIQPSLHKIGSFQIHEDPTVLATSFAWHPWPMSNSGKRMSFAVTFSSGETKLFVISKNGISKLSCYDVFQDFIHASIDPSHTLEAWTAAFPGLPCGTENERMLFTGGDDSVLALHCIKDELDYGRMRATEVFRDRKSHGAGVTAILPILDLSRSTPRTKAFVTGSYDEHIRVFTIEENSPHKRRLVAELRLGGGVWRLKKLSESLAEKAGGGGYVCSVLILASCMHAGARIVRVIRHQGNRNNDSRCHWELDVVGQFSKGHESMCYAADSMSTRRLVDKYSEGVAIQSPKHWRDRSDHPHNDDDPPRDYVIVSTSFYDKKICIWSFHYEVTAVEKVNADVKNPEETIEKKYTEQSKASDVGGCQVDEPKAVNSQSGKDEYPSQEGVDDPSDADSDAESWTVLPSGGYIDEGDGKERRMSWASEGEDWI
jgi:diphthine methyl ester acylhydrolase